MANSKNVTGTVIDVSEKTSQKGTTYWSLRIKDSQTGKEHFWNAFDEKPKTSIGDVVNITGTINKSGDKTFRNIKEIKVKGSNKDEINKSNDRNERITTLAIMKIAATLVGSKNPVDHKLFWKVVDNLKKELEERLNGSA